MIYLIFDHDSMDGLGYATVPYSNSNNDFVYPIEIRKLEDLLGTDWNDKITELAYINGEVVMKEENELENELEG